VSQMPLANLEEGTCPLVNLSSLTNLKSVCKDTTQSYSKIIPMQMLKEGLEHD